MKITRTSVLTGLEHTLDLAVTDAEVTAYKRGISAFTPAQRANPDLALAAARALVQKVFPHLTAAERKFIITGVTEEEHNKFVSLVHCFRTKNSED